MNNLKITFYHPTLHLLSDRTLRGLLKRISSLAREIQVEEVLHLIRESSLSLSEQQSIRDRVRPDLNHISAYYVEKIEKGSVEILIALTAGALWLLQATIGESIKEAWKKAQWHKDIVDYLTTDRRRKVIEQNVDKVFEIWDEERFLVHGVTKAIDIDEDIVITVILKTPVELELRLGEAERVDLEFIVRNAKLEIAALEKREDDPRG